MASKNIENIMRTICQRAFLDVVGDFPSDSGGNPIYTFNFFPGTPNEINRRLLERTNSPDYKNKRFPMIGFIYNYKETSGTNGLYGDMPLTLWMMHPASLRPNYEDRYTDTFSTVLNPYWDAINNRIRKSGYVITDIAKGVEFEKTNRPDWGKYVAGLGNTANNFGEMVDGIEVQLKLTFTNNNGFATNKANRTI